MLLSSSSIYQMASHMISCGSELYVFLKSINRVMNLFPFLVIPLDHSYFTAILFNNLWICISVPTPVTNPIYPYPIYFYIDSLSFTIGSNFFLISVSTTQTIIGYIVSNLIFLISIIVSLSFISSTILDLQISLLISPN